jgi:mannose-6-phosphate isomerase-like protein (cupin superfamily)
MSYPPALYLGGKGEISAALRSAETPPDLAIGTRARVGLLATAATTDGHFGLYRWDMTGERKSSTPTGHYHRTFSESFFILEGTVALYDGETWRDTKPGDYFYVPPGGVHSFTNTSGAPASMLVLFAPGTPREKFFQELGQIATSGRELTREEWAELYARHDQYLA